jgi:hypothetical protein
MTTSISAFIEGVLGIGDVVEDKHGPRLLCIGVVLHEDTLEDAFISEVLLDLEFPSMLVSSDELGVQVGCLIRDGTEVETLGGSLAFALGLELFYGNRLSLNDDRLRFGMVQ